MGWFSSTPIITFEDKKKTLETLIKKIEGGDSSDPRALIAMSMPTPVSGDDPIVTALLKEFIGYALPDEEKKKKTDFFTWWKQATTDQRKNRAEYAMAYVTSR
jgi:hypothetical protein